MSIDTSTNHGHKAVTGAEHRSARRMPAADGLGVANGGFAGLMSLLAATDAPDSDAAPGTDLLALGANPPVAQLLPGDPSSSAASQSQDLASNGRQSQSEQALNVSDFVVSLSQPRLGVNAQSGASGAIANPGDDALMQAQGVRQTRFAPQTQGAPASAERVGLASLVSPEHENIDSFLPQALIGKAQAAMKVDGLRAASSLGNSSAMANPEDGALRPAQGVRQTRFAPQTQGAPASAERVGLASLVHAENENIDSKLSQALIGKARDAMKGDGFGVATSVGKSAAKANLQVGAALANAAEGATPADTVATPAMGQATPVAANGTPNQAATGVATALASKTVAGAESFEAKAVVAQLKQALNASKDEASSDIVRAVDKAAGDARAFLAGLGERVSSAKLPAQKGSPRPGEGSSSLAESAQALPMPASTSAAARTTNGLAAQSAVQPSAPVTLQRVDPKEVRTAAVSDAGAQGDVAQVLVGSGAGEGVLRTPERAEHRPSSSRLGAVVDGFAGVSNAAPSAVEPAFQPQVLVETVTPEAIAETLGQWVTHGVQSAELIVDGLDGSAVEVSISLNGDQAQVALRADQPEVRQALEAASSQLKDLLSSQGLQLSGFSVAYSGGQASQPDGRQTRAGLTQPTQTQDDPVGAAVRPSLNTAIGRALDLFV